MSGLLLASAEEDDGEAEALRLAAEDAAELEAKYLDEANKDKERYEIKNEHDLIGLKTTANKFKRGHDDYNKLVKEKKAELDEKKLEGSSALINAALSGSAEEMTLANNIGSIASALKIEYSNMLPYLATLKGFWDDK